MDNLENVANEEKQDETVIVDEVEELPEGETQEDEAEELEPWQISDDQEPEEIMPVSSHVRAKKKLKGKIDNLSKENEILKSELEALKSPTKPITVTKRPSEFDFETEEEYLRALDEYETARFQKLNEQQNQEKALAERQRRVTEAVDAHYDRAEKLIEKYNINPDLYKDADAKVRAAADAVAPGFGDRLVDNIISNLGEHSEKLFYQLGINKPLLAQFQSALTEDKASNSAMKTALFLGRQIERLTTPRKAKSKAPSPAPEANGNESPSANGAALKRKYDAAHKKNGGGQEAYNIKKEARAAGVDVSTW